jgi:hypothetical protein
LVEYEEDEKEKLSLPLRKLSPSRYRCPTKPFTFPLRKFARPAQQGTKLTKTNRGFIYSYFKKVLVGRSVVALSPNFC